MWYLLFELTFKFIFYFLFFDSIKIHSSTKREQREILGIKFNLLAFRNFIFRARLGLLLEDLKVILKI